MGEIFFQMWNDGKFVSLTRHSHIIFIVDFIRDALSSTSHAMTPEIDHTTKIFGI